MGGTSSSPLLSKARCTSGGKGTAEMARHLENALRGFAETGALRMVVMMLRSLADWAEQRGERHRWARLLGVVARHLLSPTDSLGPTMRTPSGQSKAARTYSASGTHGGMRERSCDDTGRRVSGTRWRYPLRSEPGASWSRRTSRPVLAAFVESTADRDSLRQIEHWIEVSCRIGNRSGTRAFPILMGAVSYPAEAKDGTGEPA